MTKNFIRVGGWPCAPAVARDLVRLLAGHKRDLGYGLGINSIYRTRSEQAAIFTQRYRRNGLSPYNDYRVYDGSTWGRISGLGPVASPDVGSNHTRGYAIDFAVTAGDASWKWLRAHAAEYGFNDVEGRSIAEAWHWCWRIEVRPDASSPDPWEGRGAPDPVHPTDQGMSLDNAAGSGGGSSAGNTNEEEWLMAAADDVKWTKDRIGGSTKDGASLTSEVRDLRNKVAEQQAELDAVKADVTWLKDRVGGKGDGPSITDMLRTLLKG